MTKKVNEEIEKDKIIENEPIATNEKNNISEAQVSEIIIEDKEETKKINELSIENTKTQLIDLEILEGFSDKYTGVKYKIGDIISFEKTRADELLADYRKLVKIASK